MLPFDCKRRSISDKGNHERLKLAKADYEVRYEKKR